MADPTSTSTPTMTAAPAPASQPASAAAGAPKPSRPRRARRGAQARPRSWRDLFDRRRIAGHFSFSRDGVLGFLKNMAWVAPLTLLIWVYAEREQVTPFESEVVPFELSIAGPDKVVRAEPGTGSSLMVDLRGPRARVMEVLQDLRSGDYPQGLQLRIDPGLPPGPHRIPALPLVANHPILVQSGISVTRVIPDRLDVVVDEVMEADIPIAWDAQAVRNLGPATTFRPPAISVRGPRDVIQNRRAEEFQAIVDLSGRDELNTPGVKEVRDLPVELPPALRDQVTILSPSPAVVDATLDVLDPDAEIVIPAITVFEAAPQGLLSEYELRFNPSLPNVRLIGPKDQIDLLSQPGAPKPKALLQVTREDEGEKRRKRVTFLDLPPGVRVSEQDRSRTIEFDLVPRASGGINR